MKNTTASSPSLLGVILIAAITIGMYLAMSIYGGTLAENNGRIAPGKSKEILMKKGSLTIFAVV